MRFARTAAAGMAAAALAAPVVTGIAAAPADAATPIATSNRPLEYVDVNVATVWTSPSSPRPIDHKALTNPADVPGWLADMTPQQEEGLTDDNITQTQALYGQAVYVLSHRAGWTEVAVTAQPSPKNALGYPGWIPDNQLTAAPLYGALQSHESFALIDHALSAWLYDDPALRHRDLQLSINTRLPVLAQIGHAVLVDTPDRGAKWLAASDVHVYRSDAQIPRPSGADLVRTAKIFLHQPYLWAGRSGFGVDCSGFTSTIYQLHGITIPRDSGPQAVDPRAQRVGRDQLRAGDLLFYSSGDADSIYHVAMYVGAGKMIEAYDHLTPVRVTAVRFGTDYWGAVRYLHG